MAPWRWRWHGNLKDFTQELARGRLQRRYDRGVRQVPVAQIVGSAGKAASLDRRFRSRSGKESWRLCRIREINDRLGALPPVELYAINDEYYVVDGHHRVAVALENEQVEIDAYVTVHEVEYPAEPSAISHQPSAGASELFRRWRTAVVGKPRLAVAGRSADLVA